MRTQINTILLLLVLAAMAFGTNWMAYEQHRANLGFSLMQGAGMVGPQGPADAPTATPKKKGWF